MKLGFDISQIGSRRKAGCGFYASALLAGIVAIQDEKPSPVELRLFTSFGDFYHDPRMALEWPYRRPYIQYGPRFLRRSRAATSWNSRDFLKSISEDLDLIQVCNFWMPPIAMSCPVVYTVYDLSFIECPQWSTEVNRMGCHAGMTRAAEHANWFVAISQSSRTRFLQHFPDVPEHRVRVVHPASRFAQPGFVGGEQAPKLQVFGRGQPFFLSVGTLEPRKNQLMLIDAYARFRSSGGAAIPLILAGGNGWLMEEFETQLASNLWREDIHVLGYVSNEQLIWLYRHCLANFYPSHYEGFGLPVLEGMEQGAPTICSNSTSMPEIAGNSALLLDPHDGEAWSEAMNMVSTEAAWRRSMGSWARARAQQFNWQRSVEELLSLYQDVIV